MSAGIYNIFIEQGSTFSQTIVYKGPDREPIDLSAVTSVVGQIRPTAESSTETPFTLAVVDPATDGTISWIMSADSTSSLVELNQVYDIELHWVNGDVTRLLQGSVLISPEVTRS